MYYNDLNIDISSHLIFAESVHIFQKYSMKYQCMHFFLRYKIHILFSKTDCLSSVFGENECVTRDKQKKNICAKNLLRKVKVSIFFFFHLHFD